MVLIDYNENKCLEFQQPKSVLYDYSSDTHLCCTESLNHAWVGAQANFELFDWVSAQAIQLGLSFGLNRIPQSKHNFTNFSLLPHSCFYFPWTPLASYMGGWGEGWKVSVICQSSNHRVINHPTRHSQVLHSS